MTHDPRLQRGLVPEKTLRVDHSCGFKHPRELKRFHARLVQDDTRSVPLNELYPDVDARAAEAP